jgi:hypothetical protein
LDSIFHCISPDLITELENCTNTWGVGRYNTPVKPRTKT